MHPSHVAAIEIEAESTLGEDVTTFADLRVPQRGQIDLSGLDQRKIDPELAVQYLNDGTKHIIGPMGGTFTTRTYLTGHGSSTSGSTSVNAYETWLGDIIGGVAVSASSGTTASGGTASAPTTAAANGFAAGSLCRIGTLGDGRGNGQAAAISSHSSNTLNLLTAIDAAPNSGDVIYSGVNIYPKESPTETAVTSYRMRALTANDKYELHGCVPTSYTFSGLNTGETPMLETTWALAWFRRTTSGTFPSTLSTHSALPAPVAAGSFFWNEVGTATRNKLAIRSFTIETTIGMELQHGPGGLNAYQTLVSARRTQSRFKISFIVDAEANTASPAMDTAWLSTAFHHALYTLSCTNGSSVAFYFPKLEICDARPIQRIDNNVNRYLVTAYAYTAASGSTDLERSAWRMFFS